MTNMKFFNINKLNSSATYTFTSASTSLASYLYDNDYNQKLISVGSNDATPEVWVITFSGTVTFDRIFLANHNIKSGDLKYWDGASYVAFSSAISWSANTTTNNYYEFTSVSTTKIQLTMNTTMVANAEKYVGQLRVFLEIGTLDNNPYEGNPEFSESSKNIKTDNNSSVYVFFGAKYRTKLKFSNCGVDDLALIRSLKDLRSSFYVYPCGGTTGLTEEGFRIQDMYLVNYVNAFAPNLNKRFGTGVKIDVELQEAS